ncbi:MAG: type III-A CRISPR-associated protein Csm2 [Pseudomonadales bacterium]|jgi:CRISPR-associated protein Csm2|nr:type III-A CRISPR-associated protein Csm2 [Calditrichota bacterium]MCP5319262.1 type III-A CRISPR-associated protein Csm2 [Pseudomonadales bacterium]MCP5338394.1 type III-A CRISPR-associated protein Csm2 [Pseudomonadales bacterium]
MKQTNGSPNRGGANQPSAVELDTSRIQLGGEKLPPNLLDEVAESCAKAIGVDMRSGNKASQLRGFYDEVVLWEERVRREPGRYDEYLPLIRMLVAKVTYARGRGHVTPDFENMIRACVKQLKEGNPRSLRHFKLFFEAFMGFYKVHGPRG